MKVTDIFTPPTISRKDQILYKLKQYNSYFHILGKLTDDANHIKKKHKLLSVPEWSGLISLDDPMHLPVIVFDTIEGNIQDALNGKKVYLINTGILSPAVRPAVEAELTQLFSKLFTVEKTTYLLQKQLERYEREKDVDLPYKPWF